MAVLSLLSADNCSGKHPEFQLIQPHDHTKFNISFSTSSAANEKLVTRFGGKLVGVGRGCVFEAVTYIILWRGSIFLRHLRALHDTIRDSFLLIITPPQTLLVTFHNKPMHDGQASCVQIYTLLCCCFPSGFACKESKQRSIREDIHINKCGISIFIYVRVLMFFVSDLGSYEMGHHK